MIHVCSMDVCTKNLRQKAERGEITGSESTTRFLRVYCFEKPTCSVPEIWGRTYNVLPWGAKGTKMEGEIGFPCSQEWHEETSK
jgi:hypothetical protein